MMCFDIFYWDVLVSQIEQVVSVSVNDFIFEVIVDELGMLVMWVNYFSFGVVICGFVELQVKNEVVV